MWYCKKIEVRVNQEENWKKKLAERTTSEKRNRKKKKFEGYKQEAERTGGERENLRNRFSTVWKKNQGNEKQKRRKIKRKK